MIDDLGLSREAFEAADALAVPVTLAFLPYGKEAQAMLDEAAPRHETILHLPMEPKVRKHHAGPDAVAAGPEHEVRRALEANLDKLSGYRGVNNHTGSSVTEDEAAMRVVLEELSARSLYFLDSRTSPNTVAADLAAATEAVVIEGTFFIDGGLGRGGAEHVRRQLERLERIAAQEGSAIGIGHPYDETLAVLASWTEEAGSRIHFVTAAELAAEKRGERATGGS